MQDPDTSMFYLLIVFGQCFIQRLPLEDIIRHDLMTLIVWHSAASSIFICALCILNLNEK